MGEMKALILFAVAVSLSGCTVPTTYSKSIAVKKDAAGNVLETVETETVLQHGGQGYPVKFEHLKGVRPSGVSQEHDDETRSGYEFRKSK